MTISASLGRRACAAALLVSFAAAGCGDDDDGAPPKVTTYTVAVAGLAMLDAGKGHYEAWLAFPEMEKRADDGSAAPAAGKLLHGDLELISIGKFRVNGSGDVVGLDGGAPSWSLRPDRNPQFAAEGWISIEQEGDQDTIPGGLLMAGPFVGNVTRGTAALNTAYRSIWDLEFADLNLGSLAGTYTLETPSDGDGDNEGQGIFWRDGGAKGLASLPVLDGVRIRYEGWIEETSTQTFFSTGRFLDPRVVDLNGPGAPGDTLGTPGEEFFGASEKVLNSGGYRALVTLEPTNDNDPARPTEFVLLSDPIEAAALTGVSHPMTNVTGMLPTASFIIDR
jgi:hypothetical protein